MNRIIDANLNRATEALRVLEEISRFYLNDSDTSTELKHLRHSISKSLDSNYEKLLNTRDTVGDVGTDVHNPSSKTDISDVFKANFKRLEQALRVLAEYAPLVNLSPEIFEKSRYESYTLEKQMFEKLTNKINKIRLQDKKLYLVTDRSKFDSLDAFYDAVCAALKGGVQILQLREKNADAKEFVEIAKKLREICSLFDAVFIINDRVDIAHIVDADGVHLGQNDIDISAAREILGNNKIVGISTHCPEQAIKAVESGADYIGVGPIFETPTKPGRKSVGLEYAKWASENIEIPWYAIGGINLENAKDVIKAGANRIAVVRAIINSDKPQQTASDFLKLL